MVTEFRKRPKLKKPPTAESNNGTKAIVLTIAVTIMITLLLLIIIDNPVLNLNWKARYWKANQNQFDMFGKPAADMADAPEIPLVENMQCETNIGTYNHAVVKFDVYAKTSDKKRESLNELVRQYPKQIANDIRTIVATSSDYNLKDPKLGYIRSQIKQGVENVVGPDLVEEILIPSWQMNTYN